MDYDADGRLDIVTGSYTGEFYLFLRQPDGAFAQRQLLVDETGATLMMPFDTIYSVTAELVDMDADGDLDLVVGARSAAVQIVANVGTRAAPKWSKERRELKTEGGEVIKGSNAHHADWDGDGTADLIVGGEHDGVRWYRNVGAKDAPRYAAGEVLVRPNSSAQQAEGSTPKGPGSRLKVHVTDWDQDGRADLLVGDVTWQESVTGPPLTPAEVKEQEALQRQMQEIADKIAAEKDEKVRAELGKARKELSVKYWSYDRTKTHTHGWVWLYRRAPAPAAPR
ncbi:MAG: VCBS repeat-containing protein [Planctomycetes bacterium]|nr:VCBS repeat-containing protein [Planctomycetota bacterium]